MSSYGKITVSENNVEIIFDALDEYTKHTWQWGTENKLKEVIKILKQIGFDDQDDEIQIIYDRIEDAPN